MSKHGRLDQCPTPSWSLKVDENSVASLPVCQEFDLIDDGNGTGILTHFGCGAYALTQIAEPSVIIAPTLLIRTLGASSSLSSASATAVSDSHQSNYSRNAALGVTIPVSLFILSIAFYLSYRGRRRRQKHPIMQQQNNPKGPELKSSDLGSSRFIPGQNSNPLTPLSRSEISSLIHFLSIYGRQGVLLRELIMLVSALCNAIATFCRHPHWSRSGQREVANLRHSQVFFWTFLHAFEPKDLQTVEEHLVHVGAITLKDVDRSTSSTSQDWVTDSRSWCARSDHSYSKVDKTKFCRDLLAIYSQMPDKDIHPLAERYREIFYYHAHAAIVHVFRLIRDKEVFLDEYIERFYGVALQVFSHRYQLGDKEMLEFVRERTASAPDKGSKKWLFFERHVILQLVEIKATVSRQSSRPMDQMMKRVLDSGMVFIDKVIKDQELMSSKASGTVGYILAELMNTTMVSRDEEAFNKAVQLAREWCDKALISRTPIEMAALCCVLVKLRAIDKLDEMPQDNHLSCGYYLARTGSLQLAEYFILSGIHYFEQKVPKAPIWRYHLELWTVRIRLGQWKEAEHWLSMTWETLSERSNDFPGGGFDIWKQSGELGEFRLVLASLLSDCYTARGNFVEARKMILFGLGTIRLMRDAFIKSTRIALKSRLLNVQSQLRDWYNASATAIDLSRELQERDNIPLEWQTTSWTIQEILAFVNELMHEELYTNAYHVLRELRRLSEEEPESMRVSIGLLPDDLTADIDLRWNEVKSILGSKGQSAPSGEFSLPEVTSEEIQPPMPEVASPKTSEPRLEMTDRGYTFPSPGRIKAIPELKSMVPSPHIHTEQDKVSHNLLRKERNFMANGRLLRYQRRLGMLPQPPKNNPSRPKASEPAVEIELPTLASMGILPA